MPRPSLPESSSTPRARGVDPAKGRGREINDEALRLESRPSPILPAVLAGSLSVLILGVIGLAASVKIDQIVTVPGKLVTRRSTQELTTPEQGVVKEVLVSNGQAVEKGQALVVLDPRVQTSDVNELERQLVAEGSRQASAQARVRERIAGLERQLQIDQRVSWRPPAGSWRRHARRSRPSATNRNAPRLSYVLPWWSRATPSIWSPSAPPSPAR